MVARTTYLLYAFKVILTGLLLTLLFSMTPLVDRAVVLDVGAEGVFRAPDETATVRRMAGFYEPELANGVSYRWTKSWARVTVPWGHRLGRSLQVRLRLCGCHPDGDQPTARLLLDNQPIGELPTTSAYRRYVVLAPPDTGAIGSDLFFELRTPTAEFDGRPVGVRLDSFEIVAAPGRAIAWPAALLLALIGAATAAVALWPGANQRFVRAALIGALFLAPALVLSLYRHQDLWPSALALATLNGVLLVALLRPGRLTAALLLPILCALPLVPQLLGGWLVDDAFISFRYAQQLVMGNGLVFNPGERVEGYTNFLWTMVAAAIIRLGGEPTYVTRLLTLLIAQATIALCYAVGRRVALGLAHATGTRLSWQVSLRDAMLSLAAPLLVATSGPFLLYSARGSGLETALFALLLLGGVWAYTAERWRLCGALLALAALTRPEGVLVEAITVAILALGAPRERSRLAAQLGAFMLIFVPYYVWRYIYYGLPLPNTFYVKVGASWAQVLRGTRYLADYWVAEGWAWALGLTALIVVIALRARNGRSTNGQRAAATTPQSAHYDSPHVAGITYRPRRLPSLPWLSDPLAYIALTTLAYMGYVAFVGGDWLPEARFIVPLIPLYALLAQAGLAYIARSTRWGTSACAVLLALALFDHARHTAATSAYDPANLIWRENDTVWRRREVGRWLRDNTPAATLVAVEAAGALPYYSQRPAIDILGLNDRHIASLDVATIGQGKPGHEKIDIPYVLDRRPDIIPYFSVPYFAGQPRFHQEYASEEHDGPEGYTVIVYRRIP